MKKAVQFRHFSNRHFSHVVTNSDLSALHISHFTQWPDLFTHHYFSTTKLNRARPGSPMASLPARGHAP
jgi:hypothetical protein